MPMEPVKPGGKADQLHRAVVHVHVRERHVGIVASHLADHVAPELHTFQDIGLVHGNQVFPARPGQLKAHAGDSRNFRFRVDEGVDAHAQAVLVPDAAGFAEVEVAREFPYDQNVDPGNEVPLQRRGVQQVIESDDGPQVGKKSELLPQSQQRPFRPMLIIQAVPFRSANRAEQNGVAFSREVQAFLRQGFAAALIGGAADEAFPSIERRSRYVGYDPDHLEGFPHDLRSDPVAGENADFKGFLFHDFSSQDAASNRRHGSAPA
jgi:hypothetical protein